MDKGINVEPFMVMDSDIDNNILSLAIEIRGIKTKKLLNIKENILSKLAFDKMIYYIFDVNYF